MSKQILVVVYNVYDYPVLEIESGFSGGKPAKFAVVHSYDNDDDFYRHKSISRINLKFAPTKKVRLTKELEKRIFVACCAYYPADKAYDKFRKLTK